MNAPSPGIIALFQPNEYYPSLDEYLDAIGEAMKTEYEAIVAAGFQLQIDAPDLAMGRHIMYRDRSDEEFVAAAERHVEAINRALRDVPADRVRLHLCWGNYEGPHHLDIDVAKILDVVLRAKPATILFEAANPRHEHEWATWREAEIPADKILVPGVIDYDVQLHRAPGPGRAAHRNLRRHRRPRPRDGAAPTAASGRGLGSGPSTPTSAGPSWPRWPRARGARAHGSRRDPAQAHRPNVELIQLVEHGVHGNSHGIMLERNNGEALAVLTRWVEARVTAG